MFQQPPSKTYFSGKWQKFSKLKVAFLENMEKYIFTKSWSKTQTFFSLKFRASALISALITQWIAYICYCASICLLPRIFRLACFCLCVE